MRRRICRIKLMRTCDLLLASIVFSNVLYIIYCRTVNMGSDVTLPDEEDLTTNIGLVPYSGSVLQSSGHEFGPADVAIATSTKQSDQSQQPEEQTTLLSSILEPCPDQPPSLVGELACDCNPVSADFLVSHYENMQLGGVLSPLTCKPAQKVAVIIPYRDRYTHLHILLNMLIPFLTRQQVDATFFVIEQTDEAFFNRAALQNIGFLEALKLADFDCFVFHDVDLVPLNDRHLYRCGAHPQHFSVTIQTQRWKALKEMYKEYTGGVIAFTRQQYQAINGNSNLYFGWGGEDDDLYQRILNKDIMRMRARPKIAHYIMLGHPRQEAKGESPQRFTLLETARERQDVEGLNTSKYKVNQIRSEHLYTWINVSINSTEVLLTAPSYVLHNMKQAMERSKGV